MNRFPSPENSDRSSIAAQLVFFSQGTAIAVIAIGIATICGWLFDLPLLVALHPRFAAMKANTALCFILSGMALGLEHCAYRYRWRWLQSVERAIAGSIGLIALFTLGQYLTGFNFGIDELLISQPEPFGQLSTPGRMAPNTAVAFLGVGFALVAMKSHRPNYLVVQILAAVAGFIGFAGLMGYVYGSVYFYTTHITGMAFHTAIAFLLLSSGILCAHPDRGLARLVRGQGAGSIVIRQLLPLAICLPPLVSGITHFGYHQQLYPVEVEVAIATTLNVVIFVALVIRNTLTLNRIDACRQQVEARLVQLAAIVDSSQDAIISQSIDGTILSWNAAAEQMFGYRAQDTIGKSFCPIVPPELKPDFHAILQRVLQGERVEEYEMQCFHQDGHRIEIAATISPIYEARTPTEENRVRQIIGVSTIQRDISARKHLELQLQSLSQRLEFLLSTSPAVIFSFQPQFGDRITYISSNVTQVLGYPPHHFKRNPHFWQERVHPEDLHSVLEIFHQAIESGYGAYEYRFLHADGTYRWLHEAIRSVRDDLEQPLEIVGYLVDIGDRKQTELELLRSRDLREAVFNGSTDALFLVDPISLLTMDCNERAVELFEAENREALIQIEGHRLQKQPFTPEELEQINQDLQTQGFWHLEVEYLTKKGNSFWGSLAAKPIQVGEQTLQLVRVSDISDRKCAELALQQAKEAAEIASNSKSTFLANMSHELRTPLNAILGFAQILNRDPNLTPQVREYLQIIQRSGDHLLSLINDVLDLSKIEAGRTTLETSSFDLHTLLRSLWEMLRERAENRGLYLALTIADEVPQYIEADESKLRQVLINLLGNAIKFTPRGSVTLRVQASRFQQPTASSPRSVRLRFAVIDTGIGIAAQDLETIFEAFVQASSGKKMSQGTGLGLTISRKFVELMGGQLSVSSQESQGSTFAFEIPVNLASDRVDSLSPQTRQPVALAPDQPAYRLLVVDDNAENRFLLVKILQDLGFQVNQASSGSEALALWESWQPDLIWMDIRMPDLDGYEVTQRIRSTPKGQSPIIVALTAQASVSDRSSALASGCNDYLTKPLQDRFVFAKLTEYLGVRYVYAEEDSSIGGVTSQLETLPLDAASLGAMSAEWLNQLYQASRLCDYEVVLQLLEQIPDSELPLRHALEGLANNFQFKAIANLISDYRKLT